MKRLSLALPLLLLACSMNEPESNGAAGLPQAPSASAPAPNAATRSDEAALAGDWRIVAIDGAAVPAELIDKLEQPLLLSFDVAEGRVSGYSGCNRFFGGYRSAENPFSMDRLASSKMYCEATAELESRILQALGKVSQYRVEAAQLRLLDASGAVLVELDR